MNTELVHQDATKLAELIRTKEVSPVEVVQAHLDRIHLANPNINAIVTVASDALNAAKAAEAAVMAGEQLGPLHGVPFTAKDSIDAAGVPTQLGSPISIGVVPACHGRDRALQRDWTARSLDAFRYKQRWPADRCTTRVAMVGGIHDPASCIPAGERKPGARPASQPGWHGYPVAVANAFRPASPQWCDFCSGCLAGQPGVKLDRGSVVDMGHSPYVQPRVSMRRI